MDRKKTGFFLIDIVLAALLIVIDQLTKKYAVMYLKDNEPVNIIKDVLQLYYLPGGNKGAAFGILQGQRVFFLLITVIVVAAILFFLIRIPPVSKYRFLRVLLVFVAAGGLGNMIDRMSLNYVIDFIYIKIINFPIFNVADMYVSCSIVLLAAYILFKLSENDLKELSGYLKINGEKK
ncbi:MAG: signal peptidase II [Lachnospiraceae bacterium]|nr:signal peptidase II [Lachnospiraceae bacterium]